MLKRAFYLLLLSFALLLLMSLMVVSAEAEAPQTAAPGPVHAVMLPPKGNDGVSFAARDNGEGRSCDEVYAWSLQKQMPPLRPIADANGVPVAGSIYCLSAYFAFCLSASAG